MAPALLGLFSLLVYNTNFRQIGAADTLSARYLPLILWHNGTLNMDANARVAAHGHPITPEWERPAAAETQVTFFEPSAYWMIRTREQHLVSVYPVVTPLLVTPLYYPAVRWLNAKGWKQPEIDRAAELMEKISASLVASIACVLMYLVLRRDGNRWALLLALGFAFGTNTWMISSQALWQHGTAELLIAVALLLAVSTSSPGHTALLGAVCALMVANRPPDALIAGPLALFMVWSRKCKVSWCLAGALVPTAALLYYNCHLIGHFAGGYGYAASPSFFHLGWTGVPGLLCSPARGLLVFSPFLVFLPVGLMQRLRSPGSKVLAIALTSAVAAQLLFYAQIDWSGGVSWGPRYLTDLLPILMWMLAPAPLVLRPFTRGLFIMAMVASVAVQTIGAFWYTKTSDELIFAGNTDPLGGVWNPGHVPFLIELRHPPARGELLYDAQGSIDRVGRTHVHDRSKAPHLEPGAMLEGWALTGGRTPAQIVLLIDGIVMGSTGDFLPRMDISEARHTASPSGWRVPANTRGVSPGEHVLQLAVRVGPRSDFRIVREQRVLVSGPPSP